jgi:branched-chain amino acid transport system substrate-binding protein
MSIDCTELSGPALDDSAVVIGSLFTLDTLQGSSGRAWQNSVRLAVEEINVEGIPLDTSGARARHLLLVSCDASRDIVRAGRHLIDELGAVAVIGPDFSEDVLTLSREVSVPGGALVISPTALVSSIADLPDRDLTWQMTPTDAQRADLIIDQLQMMEAQIKQERAQSTVKLALVYRDDAFGRSTRSSLHGLTLNGARLSDAINLNDHVRFDAYDLTTHEHASLLASYLEFAPDIIVLVGTNEMITQVLIPLERAWPGGVPRPLYLLEDPAKVPELLDSVAVNEELRKRIRGVGVAQDADALTAHELFLLAYAARYPAEATSFNGLGSAYDAVYAIAAAIQATPSDVVSGNSIARGLHGLPLRGENVFVQASALSRTVNLLTAGQPYTLVGSFGPLSWGPNGAILGGKLEVWCVEYTASRPSFAHGGVYVDLADGLIRGMYTQCR